MKGIWKCINAAAGQLFYFLVLGLVVLILTVFLHASSPGLFIRFLGTLSPPGALFGITILGFALLAVMQMKGWFVNFKKPPLLTILKNAALTVLFVLPAIFTDLQGVFPEDMNIAFPQSLLFYPIIAFVVEVVFHIVPLILLLLMLTAVFKKVSHKKTVWMAIMMVSLLEPIYQSYFAMVQQHPLWSILLVGMNLYAFNFLQLLLFKKYGFLIMYGMRLVYYLFWHIGWGALRLELLFET